ncbi:MAG: serine--tRNA ligase [Acidobacteria bacterium]|nr:serine--tRNA ligase [Acidobacteriota bacterium]
MLDLKFIRDHLDQVEAMLKARGGAMNLDDFRSLESRRRENIVESDGLKQSRNELSKQIGQIIQKGEDPEPLKQQVGKMAGRIKELDAELKDIETSLFALVDRIPNMLHASVPMGKGEADNVEVSRHGQPPQFDFEPLDHVDIGNGLRILDQETAVKVTGARFAVLRGDGAKMERALIQFMMDVHSEQGYFEVLPPFIVNGASMYGTGQFPKMKEDVFKLEGLDYYLIPTAEVPVTNIHRDEVLKEEDLPLLYQAFTPCFRSEAGAYGRDTRGLIRQHQFNKVEMVKFVHPDTSEAHLESLRDHAEEILRRLGLSYRVVSLCAADLSFSAQKCYDIEVWLPGQNTYREISSCSNFGDFQARRAKIRYKDRESGKNQLVHTLNGSGLAVGRTLIAILENYQQADGTVVIPDVLVPYMNGQTRIEKQAR